MANRKNTPGIIGLGSRLFVAKESAWGTAIVTLGDFEQYNLYPQPGGRPQKTTTPIEVTQLYPSAIRRKPLKGVASVEGSLTFALPKTNNKIFWEMITGATGTGSSMINLDPEGPNSNFEQGTGGNLKITKTITPGGEEADFTDVSIGDIIDISGISSSNPATVNVVTSWDFKLGSAIDGGASNGNGLVDAEIYLQVTPQANQDTALDVGDPVTFSTLPGVGSLTLAHAQLASGDNTVGHLGSGVITLAFDFTSGQVVTGTENANGIVSTGTSTSVSITTGGQDDLEVSQLNGKVAITAKADIDSIEINKSWSLISNLQHPLVETGFTITFPGGEYGLSDSVSNSYTFVNTIGNGRIAQYSGMSPSSLTISVGTDATISTEIGFLGKDEVIADVSSANIGNFFSNGAVNTTPFDVVSGKITKINNANRNVFDNFNEVYPSWATTLRIAKKPSNFDDGVTRYQYLDGGDWTDIETSGTALADFQADEKSIIPFSDLTITIENNLEFSNYVNGQQLRTAPVQTSFRDVTVGMTIPYNSNTSPLIDAIFSQDSFVAYILIEEGATKVEILVREMCITGDGGLGDIPEGEITTSLTFTAYASHEYDSTSTAFDNLLNYSPVVITAS